MQQCLFLLLLFTEINVDGCFEVRQHPDEIEFSKERACDFPAILFFCRADFLQSGNIAEGSHADL